MRDYGRTPVEVVLPKLVISASRLLKIVFDLEEMLVKGKLEL
jgi:hypothetical protein